ncbi:hypothetical protein GCM10011452_09560 [Gemmobacter lanyuensis]|uniref:Uncharacterized protein n=1 Tax=Gemmobacter lanyuensis TaxID=1054497 RepID=A0A918INX1_9RHOB|nr:hypothetical protein [Gemmobacter lanyuensis]GGW24174.1 hypothetical protein GCM10011452_09560 [Gemmobacter lanyuensis]
MSGPDRIWLQDAGDYESAAEFEVTWCIEPQDDGDTEYIRRDPAVLATLPEVQAMIETAYEKGLSDALGIVASIGYGATEDVDRGHEDAYRAIEKHLADWKASAAALRAITEGRE